MILEVKDISVSFSGVMALQDVSFGVPEGSITGLIGPNGAGKSTFFNVISRLYHPDKGDIVFKGESLLKCERHHIPQKGIYRTFQTPEIFSRLTLLENLLLGAHLAQKSSLGSCAFSLPQARREEKKWREQALKMLDNLNLKEYAHQKADNLPLVFQRRMEIGRALLNQPAMLLLDEPMAGMTFEEKEDLIKFINRIRESQRLTIIIVEHDIKMIRKICEQLVVLNFGKKIAEGTPEEVSKDQAVIKAYLGED